MENIDKIEVTTEKGTMVTYRLDRKKIFTDYFKEYLSQAALDSLIQAFQQKCAGETGDDKLDEFVKGVLGIVQMEAVECIREVVEQNRDPKSAIARVSELIQMGGRS